MTSKPKPKAKSVTIKAQNFSVTTTITKTNRKVVEKAQKLHNQRIKAAAENARLLAAVANTKKGSALHKANQKALTASNVKLRRIRANETKTVIHLADVSQNFTKKYLDGGATIKATNLKVSKTNLNRDASSEYRITFGFVSNINIEGSGTDSIEAGTVTYRTISEGSIIDFMDERWGLGKEDYEIITIKREKRKN